MFILDPCQVQRKIQVAVKGIQARKKINRARIFNTRVGPIKARIQTGDSMSPSARPFTCPAPFMPDERRTCSAPGPSLGAARIVGRASHLYAGRRRTNNHGLLRLLFTRLAQRHVCTVAFSSRVFIFPCDTATSHRGAAFDRGSLYVRARRTRRRP